MSKFKKKLTETDVNKLKFQYLLSEVKQNKSQEHAYQICEMILRGQLKVSIRQDNKLLFLLGSKYRGICGKCQEHYEFGDPIFCRDNVAWHLKCSSPEDKQQTFYQTCLKKGLLDLLD